MSAPWAIGATLLGAGILGYWLLGPKKSPTQPPDRMPALNQAMRGSTVNVSFGANKLSAQIGWNKNFNAIRQQSSGKGGGKGGGSGGFGSMKGGSASAAQSYIYKWDLLFTYGIVDQPSYIRRGWVGSDLIVQDTLPGGGADAELAIAAYGNYTVSPNETTASLAYDASHTNRGYGTGSVSLSSWAYFVAQEGVDCRWPYNFWVGFEQMNLGQSPSVPQLSFELVPIPVDGGYIINSSYASTTTSAGQGFTTLGIVNNHGEMLGEDGKHYVVMSGSSDGVHFVCTEDGSTIVLTSTQFRADLTTKGMAAPSGTAVSDYSLYQFCFPAQGTAKCWIVSTVADGGLGFASMGIRYKINSSSALVIDGGLTGLSDFLTFGNFSCYACNTDGTNCYGFGPVFGGNAVMTLPLTGDVTANVAGWTALFTDLTPSGSFFDMIGSNRDGQTKAAVVVQPDNSWQVLMYIGQAEYDYVVAHPTHSTAYAGISQVGVYQINLGSVTLLPDFDITDAKQHFNGSASASYFDDYAVGVTSFIQNSKTYVVMSRGFSTVADNTPAGSYARVRLYAYDGTNATEQAILEGSMYDTVSDLGFTEGNRYSIIPPTSIYMHGDSAGQLRYVWQGAATTTYRHVFGNFAANGGVFMDVTPAYITYRILTSDIFGFATNALFGFTITPERINQDSYLRCRSMVRDAGHPRQRRLREREQRSQRARRAPVAFNGFLTDLGGEIFFNFVTGTETPERTIDNRILSRTLASRQSKPSKSATGRRYNIIQFQYLDRNIEYKTNMVEESDEVDVDYTGPRIKQYQPTFTMAGSVAQVLATSRALAEPLCQGHLCV
jgi:hypothetical protein